MGGKILKSRGGERGAGWRSPWLRAQALPVKQLGGLGVRIYEDDGLSDAGTIHLYSRSPGDEVDQKPVVVARWKGVYLLVSVD